MHSSSHPRRILLCAVGLSPQIVTETVFALAKQESPAFVPNEVHIVTTREGANRAALMLLDRGQGHFRLLREAYDLPPIEFTEQHIHVVQDADGKPLEDITDDAGNTACADEMVRLVREFTASPDSALHVSIAGGRKTMGYLLGYALTLFGREQDRLSHVLVSSPFESHPEFFFPTPTPQVLMVGQERKPVDASQARVQLVQIPYVSLRSGLANLMVDGSTASFGDTIRKAQSVYGSSTILADRGKRSLIVDATEVKLPPLAFAVWLWLARRAVEGLPAISLHDFDRSIEIRNVFRQSTKAAFGEMDSLPDQVDALFDEIKSMLHTDGKKWLGERVNEINHRIKQAFGSVGRERLGVLTDRQQINSTYRLAIDPSRIEIV